MYFKLAKVISINNDTIVLPNQSQSTMDHGQQNNPPAPRANRNDHQGRVDMAGDEHLINAFRHGQNSPLRRNPIRRRIRQGRMPNVVTPSPSAVAEKALARRLFQLEDPDDE